MKFAVSRKPQHNNKVEQKQLTLKAVDFFSGAGDMSYGLQLAGLKVLAGIDNDFSCKETYE